MRDSGAAPLGHAAAGARVATLDGVRGLAILLVIAHHASQFAVVRPRTGAETAISRLFAQGWIGVDLFFVLSGYLITGLLLRARGRPRYFRNFYARRTLRIFPLYYATVFAMCVLLPALLRRDYTARLAENQGWYWAYLPNLRIFLHGDWFVPIFDHTWSLAIEEQFYLVWPVLVLVLGARRLVPATIALAAGSCALRAVMAGHGWTDAQLRVLPLSHADGLALGALVAALLHAGVAAPRLRGLGASLIASGLLLRLGAVWVGPSVLRDTALEGTAWTLVFAGGLALVAVAAPTGRLARALSAPWLRFFGTYSYGLYIAHVPIMMWGSPYLARAAPLAGSSLLDALALLVLGGALSTALAVLSFRYFEGPFLALKARFE